MSITAVSNLTIAAHSSSHNAHAWASMRQARIKAGVDKIHTRSLAQTRIEIRQASRFAISNKGGTKEKAFFRKAVCDAWYEGEFSCKQANASA